MRKQQDQAMNSELFFVYGTLRPGLSNWRWALRQRPGVLHLGQGRTVEAYSLFTAGIPYVYREPAQSRIRGDLFVVNDRQVLVDLDQLEGHRDGVREGYHRELVPVELADGRAFQAWLYFHYAPRPLGKPVTSGDWLDCPDGRCDGLYGAFHGL